MSRRIRFVLGLLLIWVFPAQATVYNSEPDTKIYSIETEETMADIGKVKLKQDIVDDTVTMTADEASDLALLLGTADLKATDFDTEKSNGFIEMVFGDKKITLTVKKVKKEEDE
jgi:predicted O-methyltransferase YrrM